MPLRMKAQPLRLLGPSYMVERASAKKNASAHQEHRRSPEKTGIAFTVIPNRFNAS
jgi:hypothetical protein